MLREERFLELCVSSGPRRSSFYILLTRLVQNLVLELRDFQLAIATCSRTAADRRVNQPDRGAAKLNRIGRNTKVLVAMLMACIFLSSRSAYALRVSYYKDCVLRGRLVLAWHFITHGVQARQLSELSFLYQRPR